MPSISLAAKACKGHLRSMTLQAIGALARHRLLGGSDRAPPRGWSRAADHRLTETAALAGRSLPAHQGRWTPCGWRTLRLHVRSSCGRVSDRVALAGAEPRA